ncbi:Developmental regulator flbA [Leucoagaricus sp. SymC.cos]|nr:Developmental regulator flbA [Leucoagaricus sp. SymC.cos]
MSAPEQEPNGSSSHMMKTTKRGRPFLKDTLDLFATLIVSLPLTLHKQFFRTFSHSFTTDEAAQNLASLKFSQSNRGPDPREPSRVVTTTTTTTFSMTREMAKAMCQHFMDARLVENATDPTSNLFKDRGVYQLTAKVNSDHLQPVFASQPICIKLLHLERRLSDDEIIVTQSVITALFRRFVGRQPNYSHPDALEKDAFFRYHERAKGIPLCDIHEKSNKGYNTTRYSFYAVAALEWLCDFTSVVGREEAAEMAAQFVRFGLITLVSDKRKNTDSAIIFTVRGSSPSGSSGPPVNGEFRCTNKAVYKITDEGRRVARWGESHTATHDSPNSSTADLASRSSVEASDGDSDRPNRANRLHRRVSVAEFGEKRTKETNADRLQYIIDSPRLRAQFREFLRHNICEENLAFWMEVEEFKRKFQVTSSAMASDRATRPGSRSTPGQAAMEKHHELLIQTASLIFNNYLAHSSPSELNIDHTLRNELTGYLEEVVSGVTGKKFQGRLEPEHASALNATQLSHIIRLYERIQGHVFRLMSTDSVPKFMKSPGFQASRTYVEDLELFDGELRLLPLSESSPPAFNDEVGGAYVTISQQATEREHRMQQARQAQEQQRQSGASQYS